MSAALVLYLAIALNSWWVFLLYPVIALFRYAKSFDRDLEDETVLLALTNLQGNKLQ